MQADRRRFLQGLAACAAAPFARAAEPAYPQRTIRMVVGYAPGGQSDLQGRAIADRLGRALGQTVIVENVAGASGRLACEQVARAAPDGYTLIWGGLSSHVILPAFASALRYDPVRDFTMVGLAAENPVALVVSPKLGVANMQDFVKLLRDSPGKYAYGSSGIGTTTHIADELLLQTLGLKALHVPYKGMAPALLDLVAGRTQFAIDAVGSVSERVQAGELQGLLVLDTHRTPSMPAVPCLADVGIPGIARAKVVSWQGILGPAKLPAPIVARLNAALQETLADRELADRFARQGVPVIPGYTPEQSAAVLRDDLARWSAFAKTSGIHIE